MNIKKVLGRFPKLRMSILPTPIHKLEKISKIFSVNIYCKRDDLTGFAFGGNKTRKLDFLIAEAINQKADTLIALGAVQSNFCRITSAYGKAHGLKVHLILGGRKPAKPTGNLLLDYLFGAEIHYLDSTNWQDWEKKGQQLKRELITKGRKVYYLPVGGSTPIGALGYVAAFFENMDFSKKTKTYFDVIIHASSSGGTQAGLIIGKELANWPGKIIGMGVAKNKKIISKEVYNLASKTGKLLGIKVKKENVIVDDSYRGKEYGVRTRESQEAIKLFAQKEGILLDEVYTGKAAAGLLDYTKKGLLGKNQNILFIHTGGNIQLFK